MVDLTYGKFIVRVVFSLIVMTFGITIFFTQKSTETKFIGMSLVINAWMLWVSPGKTKKKIEEISRAGNVDVENPAVDLDAQVLMEQLEAEIHEN